jgi:hypothetical protein
MGKATRRRGRLNGTCSVVNELVVLTDIDALQCLGGLALYTEDQRKAARLFVSAAARMRQSPLPRGCPCHTGSGCWRRDMPVDDASTEC